MLMIKWITEDSRRHQTSVSVLPPGELFRARPIGVAYVWKYDVTSSTKPELHYR